MKRSILSLLLLQAAIMPSMAITDKKLVIEAYDGSATCVLKDIRRITFNDGIMLVDMKDGSLLSWNTSWVNCVMLGDYEPGTETSVETVLPQGFALKDGVLCVDGGVAATVQLSTCDGRVIYDNVCTTGLSLDIRSLPTGIYLLKIDGRTYKIMNR